MIRLSAGTAACMDLSSNRMDAYPTTAYLLSGKRCPMKCSFCPQGVGENKVLNRLGRVNWPEFSWDAIELKLGQAEENGIQRICLQSVRHTDGIGTLLKIISKIKAITTLPLSVSAWIEDEDEAAKLIGSGVDRISVSLDVINPHAHEQIKGGSLHERLDLLLHCADKLPGRMSTHIICGLGETEAEAFLLIERLLQAGVTPALFAFVPLKGTPLADADPPRIDSYRRIQAGFFLLQKKLVEGSLFKFENGRLISYGISKNALTEILASGEAFQTSGCPGCNRPYYNERPGGIIYNYHRQLSTFECQKSLKELFDSLKE
ncbi:MAG: radical SAM protein [Bacillota bacterium]